MDGLALLAKAREAGLKVIVAAGHLRIKGRPKHALLSRQLIENKAEVIAAIEMDSTTDNGVGLYSLDHGTGTKTLERPAIDEVLGPRNQPTETACSNVRGAPQYRLIGNGFSARPVEAVPEAIQAAPRVYCPACRGGIVLVELRVITGGKCYSCWERGVRS